MISIVIPAYNEASVISRCLDPLMEGVISGELQVIVVCNGCSDNTEELVKAYGGVLCVSTSTPSKSNALNRGDAEATGFPRFYMDADIVLSLDDIRCIASALGEAKLLAASPGMRMNFDDSSIGVRAYYDIWESLPYCRAGMIGVGVYALNEEGRNRFSKFPEIIADDRFIRALFLESERSAIAETYSHVTAPSTLSDLLKIKSRSRLGGYEFEMKFPELLGNEVKSYSGAAVEALRSPDRWLKYFVYLCVNVTARIRARRQFGRKMFDLWERDESSRRGQH